jgi:hypothetical protein
MLTGSSSCLQPVFWLDSRAIPGGPPVRVFAAFEGKSPGWCPFRSKNPKPLIMINIASGAMCNILLGTHHLQAKARNATAECLRSLVAVGLDSQIDCQDFVIGNRPGVNRRRTGEVRQSSFDLETIMFIKTSVELLMVFFNYPNIDSRSGAQRYDNVDSCSGFQRVRTRCDLSGNQSSICERSNFGSGCNKDS